MHKLVTYIIINPSALADARLARLDWLDWTMRNRGEEPPASLHLTHLPSAARPL